MGFFITMQVAGQKSLLLHFSPFFLILAKTTHCPFFMAKQQEHKGLITRPNKTASNNPARNNHLLIVGIDQYADPAIRKLNNACKDARDLVAVLQADYGFKTDHIHQLYDQEATRANILDKLDEIAEQFHPKAENQVADNLLVYFSGHGHYNPRTKLGYFIPHDAEKGRAASTFLQFGTLLYHLNSIHAHHLTLFLDSCFSGAFFPHKDVSGYESANDALGSRRLLTASLLTEASDGYWNKNSPFASALLAYLKSPKSDRFSFAELALYVEKVVGANATQKAHSGIIPGSEQHFEGQFFFQKIEKEKPDEKAFREAGEDIDALEDFIAEFPKSPLRAQARAHLRELRETQAWQKALRRNRIEDYDEFIDEHPDSSRVIEARAKINALREQKKQNQPKPAPSITPKKSTPIPPPNIITSATRNYAAIDQAMNMVRIPGGVFMMGDTFDDNVHEREKPVHEVEIAPFMLAKYTVTWASFAQFIEATKYLTDAEQKGGSYFWNADQGKWELTPGVTWRCGVDGRTRPASEGNHPVLHVSWNDALAYCNWLSSIWGFESVYDNQDPVQCNWQAAGFRLPSEAEWEYAASMGNGKKTRFGNGQDIANPQSINFGATKAGKKDYSLVGEYRQNTVPVGSLDNRNAFGLHEMSGNVLEWCWDWYDEKYYEESPRNDPRGPETGSRRVLRGGSWYDFPQGCRVAYRSSVTPGYLNYFVGFRLARTIAL
jgi:formylglycine-generating enzyme required for sulfatase activity/uncharacterized caspase-like protein